jgi:hypothetical protein
MCQTGRFHAGFLLTLFFDPEDGGDMFLINVGWLSTDYTALYRRKEYPLLRVIIQIKNCSRSQLL